MRMVQGMARLSKKERALERHYVEGYRRKPEDPAVGKVGEKLAAEVCPKENWDDIWKSRVSQQPPSHRRKPLSR